MATIAISGASGFVGTALRRALEARGDTVLALVRPDSAQTREHPPRAHERDAIRWDPARGEIDRVALSGVDAVVHLAGENVAAGRWSEAQKRRIEQSRVQGTSLLSGALAALEKRPSVFLSASAIGFYGPRGDAWVDERDGPGSDFLAQVCQRWEAAAEPARRAGIRVVHPRLGLVLHPTGGALAKMLPAFRMGVGGRLGSGAQYMSWVAREDAISALLFALAESAIDGPLNVTAPHPVTNAGFTAALGEALSRPTFMALPSFALRTLLGEMAEVALLAGARVAPRKLLDHGFQFAQPELAPFLRAAL